MKLDMRYKRFQYLMDKILEAEKMSAEKQAVIDGKKAELLLLKRVKKKLQDLRLKDLNLM